MRAIDRRRMAAKGTKSTKRKCWRPSARNPVMRLALMPRPTTEEVRKQVGNCPLCDADSSHLHVEERAPYRSQPFALSYLGISLPRWVRGTKETVCHECGSSFSGGKMHNWNIAKSARRYADIGKTRFPLPFEKRKKSLTDTLIDQMLPGKRHLVNLRKRKGITKKEKRMHRMANWARSREGLPLLGDD